MTLNEIGSPTKGLLRFFPLTLPLFIGGAYLIAARGLPVGSIAQPGPGLFPRLVAGFGLIVGICILFTRSRVEIRSRVGGLRWRESLLVVIACGGYVWLLPILGYGLASTALVITIMSAFRETKLATIVAVSIVVTVLSSWGIESLAAIRLPEGLVAIPNPWAP